MHRRERYSRHQQERKKSEQQIKLDRKNCWLDARFFFPQPSLGGTKFIEKKHATNLTARQIRMACLWYTRISVKFFAKQQQKPLKKKKNTIYVSRRRCLCLFNVLVLVCHTISDIVNYLKCDVRKMQR